MAISQGRHGQLPLMNLIRLKALPILEQLHLEERLLRASSDNWCIINDGTNAPAIVMGISGKPSELIELESVLRDRVPVIRRFTGGGTVIVDDGTVFVTFICNKDAVPGLQAYPRPIMSWTSKLYGELLEMLVAVLKYEYAVNSKTVAFGSDYVFGDHKFGGNAQSITKNRWVHHTSFLWDYDVRNMAYLKIPIKAPNYRSARKHVEFLHPMKDYLPTKSTFIEKTVAAVRSHFTVRPVPLGEIDAPSTLDPSTRLLTTQELAAFVT
ncbi:hypothetical protein ACLOJK_022334 [Asimina triloba]